jgi:hypothetical protein
MEEEGLLLLLLLEIMVVNSILRDWTVGDRS